MQEKFSKQSEVLKRIHLSLDNQSQKIVDEHNYPVGHATCFNAPSSMSVDVTQAAQKARNNNRDELNFVLIREVHWPNENTDSVSAVLSSREAGPEKSPKLHLWE